MWRNDKYHIYHNSYYNSRFGVANEWSKSIFKKEYNLVWAIGLKRGYR